MPDERKRPWVVALSQVLARLATVLVPGGLREDWLRERNAELWHRWQFLSHTGEWNRREQWLVVRSGLAAPGDAMLLLASQESVRTRASEIIRSPFTCLSVLAIVLAVIGAASSGFQATRGMFFSQMRTQAGDLSFIWLRHYLGGNDKGLPGDVVTSWPKTSSSFSDAAGVEVRRRPVALGGRPLAENPLVVTSNSTLFGVLGAKPLLGGFPAETGVVMDYRAWSKWGASSPSIVGSQVRISGASYTVTGVLPKDFAFLSRQPTFYLIRHLAYINKIVVVARVKAGVSEDRLNKEVKRLSEEDCWLCYSQGQMRVASWRSALLTPLYSFGIATLVAIALVLIVFRPKPKYIRRSFEQANRLPTARRLLFLLAKSALGLMIVFAGCLEWSRSESAVLLASRDPGSGLFLLWLYVLGAMGVMFWAAADQRGRCRVCLRLMAFPVRIGCPGCLLLDWSGTELFCSEGHGLLHVPTMAASWDEESDRWVSLDDSWKGLFAHESSDRQNS